MTATLVHPTAVVHPKADVHPTVQIGPYAVIGEQVKIGPGTVVGAHALIEGWTEIGANNHIFPGAIIGLEPQDLKYDGSPSRVRIGDNNRIRECVTVNRATGLGEETVIGNNNLLMAYVHVAHNCVIEDNVVIANAVSLAGHVRIESQAVLGGMVGIHQFVHIGRLAMVGGMSRIDRDVPPYLLVEGSPSRVRALNHIGLKRAGLADAEDGQVLKSLKQAFRLLYRSGLTLKQALEKFDQLPDNPHCRHLREFIQLSLGEHRRGTIPAQHSKLKTSS